MFVAFMLKIGAVGYCVEIAFKNMLEIILD
jgi:hypothetical protein